MVLTGRNQDGLAETARLGADLPEQLIPFVANLTDERQMLSLVASAAGHDRPLRIFDDSLWAAQLIRLSIIVLGIVVLLLRGATS